MVLGKLDSYMQKNEIRTFSHTIYKNKLKLIKELNVRLETIKLLGENMGRTLYGINHNNIFLDLSPKAKETKAKINKQDLTRLKNFCTVKETINKTKRQPMDICK